MQLCITPFPFLVNIRSISFYNQIETQVFDFKKGKLDINPNYRQQNHWKTFTQNIKHVMETLQNFEDLIPPSPKAQFVTQILPNFNSPFSLHLPQTYTLLILFHLHVGSLLYFRSLALIFPISFCNLWDNPLGFFLPFLMYNSVVSTKKSITSQSLKFPRITPLKLTKEPVGYKNKCS